jgi:hypothetical protein
LVEHQKSSCKICEQHNPNHFALHIDHCHITKRVRGLLCSRCNQGIGLLRHSEHLLEKAKKYLAESC